MAAGFLLFIFRSSPLLSTTTYLSALQNSNVAILVISSTMITPSSNLFDMKSFLSLLFQLFKFVLCEVIDFITEMTSCFCSMVFVNHCLNFFVSKSRYSLFETFLLTFTVENNWQLFMDFHFFISE